MLLQYFYLNYILFLIWVKMLVILLHVFVIIVVFFLDNSIVFITF